MSVSASAALPRPLFRDRRSAILNSLALGLTGGGWLASFLLMAVPAWWLNAAGVLLCAHTMVLAAYLIHEAAHQTLFARLGANRIAGEAANFIAGSSYASFERIRHMHIRHHMDRADVACFDFRGLMQRHAGLRRLVQALEWAYVPAAEIIMHAQVILRPFLVQSEFPHRRRVAFMLLLRGSLLALLASWSVKALVLYFVAQWILLHALNFFDAFHHTFEQYFVAADEPVPVTQTAAYEQANTWSNLLSVRHRWLNLLVLNFTYHNAHHQRASVPWHRLPEFHRQLYGEQVPAVLPVRELLRAWHRHRVRRVFTADYGRPVAGPRRADGFVGAHAVSFLTVV